MGRSTRILLLAMLVLSSSVAPAGAEPPTVAQVLKQVGFPADTERKVLGGEMVKTTLDSATERDLAVGLAFLVEVPPAELEKKVATEALVNHVDPTTIAFGKLEGEGSPAALAELKLGADEVELYRKAEAGSDLNLSSQEIEAFRALASGGSVDDQVRTQLLERYRAYRSKGLAGIAPYDRGRGATDAAGDLKKAVGALDVLEEHWSGFHRALASYPDGKGDDVQENFSWVHFKAHGEPTLALVHRLWHQGEGPVLVAHRQYYVNRGYNNEQAVAGFFPVKEGTLVVYANHTSTDQVAGFGGGAKRGIGEKVMASQLTGLFDRARKAAAQQ